MSTGTIKRLVRDRGFGFIRDDGGQEWFFHRSSVQGTFDELKEGQQIMVKCIGKEGNKIKLSRKAVLRDEDRKAEAASAGDSVSAHDAD